MTVGPELSLSLSPSTRKEERKRGRDQLTAIDVLVRLVHGVSAIRHTVVHPVPRNALPDVASDTVACGFGHWLPLPVCVCT